MKSKVDANALIRIGSQIRSLRHKKGISQEELADIAGVHRTYIGMVERGEKNITILTIIKISKALNVPVSHLIGDV